MILNDEWNDQRRRNKKLVYKRYSIGVVLTADKMRENRSRCLGRVLRREGTEAMRLAMKIYVEGKREIERPKN